MECLASNRRSTNVRLNKVEWAHCCSDVLQTFATFTKSFEVQRTSELKQMSEHLFANCQLSPKSLEVLHTAAPGIADACQMVSRRQHNKVGAPQTKNTGNSSQSWCFHSPPEELVCACVQQHQNQLSSSRAMSTRSEKLASVPIAVTC